MKNKFILKLSYIVFMLNFIFLHNVLADENNAQSEFILKSSFNSTDKNIVKNFENYLNNLKSVSGSFVQKAEGFDTQYGKFYISRPGKMKIAYDSGMEVLADGESFVYYDVDNDQISTLDLKDSPAYVLLSDDVEFGKNGIQALGLRRDEKYNLIYINIQSDILQTDLAFKVSPTDSSLLGWIVKDVQGVTTNFSMSDLKYQSDSFPDSVFVLKRHKTYSSDKLETGNDFY